MTSKRLSNITLISVLIAFIGLSEVIRAENVNWQGPAGSIIKDIRYLKKPAVEPIEFFATSKSIQSQSTSTLANVIDSPPVDGFVPWIAVTITDERGGDFEASAVTHYSVVGDFFTSHPEQNYAVGILDTGASSHVLGYQTSMTTGIYAHAANTLTPNVSVLQGVSGSVDAWVSEPLGVFIDGLDAIEPNSVMTDPNDWHLNMTEMVGHSNVSASVGMEPAVNAPDLPTAIGCPMAINFTTVIRNDTQIWAKADGVTYTGPKIDFYVAGDPEIPTYPISIPLKLIPTGSFDVQFIYDIEALLNDLTWRPGTPSIIMGTSYQSLLFVNSVSLYDGAFSAIQQDRFMLDTGAQVSVIGSNVGSLLGVDPENPEFEVDIVGVTGDTITAPGFYIDQLDIPALGQWLEYTNVPVILLDVQSPEGGYLDGIIGMNLFNEYNMVLKGDYTGPTLKVQKILPALTGDIAPTLRDYRVDILDLEAFCGAWLSTYDSFDWYPFADLALDGRVDLQDFAVIANNWLVDINP